MYSQYIVVRLTIILYNMKYERKAITLFRQQSHKDTSYLTHKEFFGAKATILRMHCVAEKDIEI